jgi:alpha-beta hydrolase superfamily lysophospholipase
MQASEIMHHSFHLTTSDGIQLAANEWRPDGTPLMSVMLIHGQGEHMGRYHLVGEVLAANGVRVIGADLRGHGISDGKRGHIKHWSDYFSDLDAVADLLPAEFAILGHSMGGLLALGYGLRNQQRVTSIAVSGPLLGVSIIPAAWKEALSGVLSVLAPSLSFDSEIPTNELCSDPEAVQRFADDALRVTTVTPRWYIEMKKEIVAVLELALSAEVPLFTHIGENETIVDPKMAQKTHDLWGCQEKSLTIWPNCCHELFQEPTAESTIIRIFGELSKNSKK